jgi:transketolase
MVNRTPIFSTLEAPFEIGKAYVLKEGSDVTLLGTGTMTYELLRAAQLLAEQGVNAEVVHVPTIKPLDEDTILTSVKKTGRAVAAEEAQAAGGFGGAIAELLSEKLPTPLKRIGMLDRFGESGAPAELMEHFNLSGSKIAPEVKAWIDVTHKYHQEF